MRRIQQISVVGLFGIFDHTIPLNVDERITIIHGPNGFGKTVLLSMLNALFHADSHYLFKVPFRMFQVESYGKWSLFALLRLSDYYFHPCEHRQDCTTLLL